VIKSAGACALACGAMGVAASAASAAAATTGSAAGVAIDLGPIPVGQQGVTVVGNCPANLYTDDIGLMFTDGNFVTSRGGNNANAEGDAVLMDNTSDTGLYTGKAHAWFGQNTNPNYSPTGNQQTWFAETVSYHGSAPDGSSITISASFGGGTSASGHESGWTHVKVTCS
jgi:hypothetical protein